MLGGMRKAITQGENCSVFESSRRKYKQLDKKITDQALEASGSTLASCDSPTTPFSCFHNKSNPCSRCMLFFKSHPALLSRYMQYCKEFDINVARSTQTPQSGKQVCNE
jgi:hypothetical protein